VGRREGPYSCNVLPTNKVALGNLRTAPRSYTALIGSVKGEMNKGHRPYLKQTNYRQE